MFVPLSVLEFRDRAAMFFGDKVGVIDGESQFTYRAFADADAPPGERARRARRRPGRPGVVHHLQHPPPARGVLRRDRGGRRPQPDQHPPRAARDRLHPRPRRLEGRLLPPRLRAARRGDPAAAGHEADVSSSSTASRAGWPTTSTRRCSPRARPTRSTPTSTRTRWPSSSTRAARPACPRASR